MPEGSSTILIIGGGIAGIQGALDAANSGAKVILVEKEATVGGKMSVLDKNFPTLDCSICIESPKMSDVGLHPNIELLTLSEVQSVKGEAGNFHVTIRQKPRFVTDVCTRCGECIPVCPQIMRSEFDVGMSARKAIYTPIEQSVPGPYVIDEDNCLNEPPNYLPCNRCMDICGPNAIDFNMKPRLIERDVASVVVATGFDLLDPHFLSAYGYGEHPDVLTSLELERLLQSSGPSMGEVLKPSDMKHPESVLFILCAGSRDKRFCDYCSRICCMYTIKEAYQLKDHGIKEVDVAYMDIRAYGKGFDEFYDRAKGSGVKFTRGRPATVTPTSAGLEVAFEDTEGEGVKTRRTYNMVVLATAVIPSRSTQELSKVLGIEVGPDGFFRTLDDSGGFVDSTKPGVYLAGCNSGPKDIPDSVLEAGAAVAKALTYVKHRSWPEALQVVPLSTEGEPRIGVFLCHCGSNIAGVVDIPALSAYAKTLPGVVHVQDQKYSCGASTLNDISAVLKEKGINRVVVASCSPKTHYATFQGSLERAGLNAYLLDMANVRNMDSWVHKGDPDGALAKAKDMVRMSVMKAMNMRPLETMKFPVTRRAVIVGGGVAGMVAATNLANQGFETHLVERQEKLGGVVNSLTEVAPLGVSSKELLASLALELRRSGAIVHTSTSVESVTGFVGNYDIRLSDGTNLAAGAIILATGAKPYEPLEFDRPEHPRVMTSMELEGAIEQVESGKNVAIISCVGSRNDLLGCSRFCCQTMINQAVRLKERGDEVSVLYRDLRAFSRYGEEEYEKACRSGVRFLQYSQDSVPEKAIRLENGTLAVRDELAGRDVLVPADIVVLNIGLQPAKEEGGVAHQLKVSVDQAGFILESHPKLGPAETMVQGVFVAGTAQYPKSVKESAVQALAAAAKASTIISGDEIEREPYIAVVNAEVCTKCARCVPVCPYSAIRGEVGKRVEFIAPMCQGCGTCVAECMVDGALTQEGFTDKQIFAQIDAALAEEAAKKVLIFACNWCSYAGADLAGVMKVQYPSNTRVIRTMCSGRVSQRMVMYAFSRGAGAVLVTGCHPGDCHYINANQQTLKRIDRWKHALQARGVNPDRLQLWWVSAAEAKRFATKATEMSQFLGTLPAQELESTTSKVRVQVRA